MRTFAISFLAALTSAMLTARTVHADDQDDYFLQNLESYGVPASAWGDDDRAIDVAKEACDLASSGYRCHRSRRRRFPMRPRGPRPCR